MIRTVLASPWMPLLYWAAAVVAMICAARHESMKRRLAHHKIQMFVTAPAPLPVPIHLNSSTSQAHSAKETNAAGCKPTRFWYPEISVLRRPDSTASKVVTEIVRKETPMETGSKSSVDAPVTMLSIRVDPPEQPIAQRLTIQCRTSVALSNANGRNVTIHGVVTQEVVSSAGKILIMAGSEVVGSGLLDPENGRFKSNGRWSIFFDDTELKVQAQLLDRPAGLPGLLGRETTKEGETFRREAVMRDGRSILVPRNAPFVLEVHGEMLLQDLKSNEAKGQVK
jgi:hypothetical protein